MKQPPIHVRHCSDCSANNVVAAGHCWLCGRPLGPKDEVMVAEAVAGPVVLRHEPLFAVLTLAAVVLALLLILGAAQTEPAIAAYVAICTGPALMITVIRALGRRVLGKPFTWQSTFATFFLSVTTILSVFGLLFIAMVAYLFVICVQTSNIK